MNKKNREHEEAHKIYEEVVDTLNKYDLSAKQSYFIVKALTASVMHSTIDEHDLEVAREYLNDFKSQVLNFLSEEGWV